MDQLLGSDPLTAAFLDRFAGHLVDVDKGGAGVLEVSLAEDVDACSEDVDDGFVEGA